MLSTSQWHQRFQQQARWTQSLRKYIYDQIGIRHNNRILDIGCGTGVLESELNLFTSANVFGLDIDINPLRMAYVSAPNSIFTLGDGQNLPYLSRSFDTTLCHFLLLWVKEPSMVLREMVRITRPGGFVIAIAEPDYGGRIDFPRELLQLGIWQTEALRKQGANPIIGRELRALFSQVGLAKVEVGVLGGQWRENQSSDDIELEWMVIQSDLHDNNYFMMQADKLHALDMNTRNTNQRILFVPTFYAIGQVPG
jgi:ubiquinone/menaquinone biosynthesis C-methylase UbiE